MSPTFTAMALTTPALEDGISVDALSLQTASRLWSTYGVTDFNQQLNHRDFIKIAKIRYFNF